MSSQSPNNGKSSSGCGTFVGVVVLVLIVVGAWNNFSGHNQNQIHNTTITPGATIPDQISPEPTLNIYIAPDDICRAYQGYGDPYYERRCQEGMQREQQILANGITASSLQVYRSYYAEEAAAESSRADQANNICSEYISNNDPNYAYDCAQAENRIWLTGL